MTTPVNVVPDTPRGTRPIASAKAEAGQSLKQNKYKTD